MIDSTPLGDVPWQTFSINYDAGEEVPDGAPSWQTSTYDVWFRDPRLVVRNMIDSPDYGNQFDSAPTQTFDSKGHRQYQDFMTGDWAWEEAVCPTVLRVIHFLSYSYLGSDRERPRNAWGYARSDHSWQ